MLRFHKIFFQRFLILLSAARRDNPTYKILAYCCLLAIPTKLYINYVDILFYVQGWAKVISNHYFGTYCLMFSVWQYLFTSTGLCLRYGQTVNSGSLLSFNEIATTDPLCWRTYVKCIKIMIFRLCKTFYGSMTLVV